MKVNIRQDLALKAGPPNSIILATCISANGKPNIITLGMYTPISHDPPMLAISVSPKRHSHKLINETKEFTVNVPTQELLKQTKFCGSTSGRNHNKFKETGLTPIAARYVKSPLIEECIANLECKVVASFEFGDHTLYIGEVLAVHVEEKVFKRSLDIIKARTLSHKGGKYFIPQYIYQDNNS
jgi:flavin reductase (DIM6/NTAB) family NADH-FMN oxidoreductase RutF